MQDTELVVTATLCLARHGSLGEAKSRQASGGFSHFNEKFISRLCGNACFDVWPEHNSYLF